MIPLLLTALLATDAPPRWNLALAEVWRVQVAVSPDTPPQPDAWGTMPARDWRGTAPTAPGQAWAKTPRGQVHSLWYEQVFTTLADPQGRHVVADFRRIEGDAVVFLNGQRLGELLRPGGEVALDTAVKAGENRLTVFLTRDYTGISRDFAHDPLRYLTRHDKLTPDQWPFGITAPVTIRARPKAAAITDVFVIPSQRKHELTVQVEVEATAATQAALHADITQTAGQPALALDLPAVALPAGRSTHRLTKAWPDVRLWELEAPYLYSCTASLRGQVADQAEPVRFGFREVWTEGRRLLLNGHDMRWRLTWANSGLTPTSLSFFRLLGFNVFQWQPNPSAWWGNWSETPIFDEATLAALDENGCGATLPVPGMSNLKPSLLTDKQLQADYDREMAYHLRFVRNHPSVFAYAVGMNTYCPRTNIHADGMGHRPAEDKNGNARAIEYACRVTRQHDPTRLAFSHADGSTGDLSTANSYLNFVPLQEREDWPSRWAASGNMPYSAVEFGEPYTANFWKGKQFLLTEYLAMYFGPQAYAWESEAGQKKIIELSLANVSGHGAFDKVDLKQWPGYWEFQRLFVRNTTRAWRTWGVNGGWQWWNFGLGYGDPPGYAGNVFNRYAALREPVTRRPDWANANFDIYAPDNQPLLAYLAGAPKFTDKSHAYWSGERIDKQVAVVWDGPGRRRLTARWSLVAGDKTLGNGQLAIDVSAGDIKLLPFAVTAPAAAQRLAARLELRVEDGGKVVATDTLPVQIHPRLLPQPAGKVALWDPRGRSRAWIEALGIRPTLWQPGQPRPADSLLVIGREALEPGMALPYTSADIQAGHRVLILEQKPEIWEGLGFRNVETMTRYVFARDAQSPILAGIAPEDLINWRGSPDLLPEGKMARDYDGPRAPRWTNTGAVASTVFEIPQVVGFTPVLSCEFDLAYTPLLHLRHGKGRITCCSLDLTDRVGVDPGATRLAANLLAECQRALAPTPAYTVHPAAAAGGLKLSERELWRVPLDGHPLLRGVDTSLLRWRDGLRTPAYDPTGQPAGSTVLLGGLALVRGNDVWLAADPALLAPRYVDDAARRDAIRLSRARLATLAAQIGTNAGARLAPEVAQRLCTLQAGAGYDELTRWQVLGPFAQAKDDGPSLIGAVIPEQADAVAGRNGPTWHVAQADEHGFVDLGGKLSSTSFAVCHVKADQARKARLRLGVDYWLAAWVNGQPVYEVTTGHGSPRANRHQVDVDLRAGDNVITLKVGSGGKGFGFWANLSRAGWDPTRLASQEARGPSFYDTTLNLADPYEFTYW